MFISLIIFCVLSVITLFSLIILSILYKKTPISNNRHDIFKKLTIANSIILAVFIALSLLLFGQYNITKSDAIKESNQSYRSIKSKLYDAHSILIDENNDIQDAWSDSIYDEDDDDFNDNIQQVLEENEQNNTSVILDIVSINADIDKLKKNAKYTGTKFDDKLDNAKDAIKVLSNYNKLVTDPHGNFNSFVSETETANNNMNALAIYN
ncbi:hypothetical protein [Weissella kandleri]|nr:hypothetical protein [Weissella kandleri]